MKNICAIGCLLVLCVLMLAVPAQAQGTVNVVLTFTASTTPSVTYNAYLETVAGACVSGSPANGTTCKKLTATPATGSPINTSDATVVTGTKFFYVVRAVNSSGFESNNSNEATLDLTPPNPATGLACTFTLSGTTITGICK